MASAEADGKFYAYPTLFPNPMSKTSSQDPKDWMELGSRDAFDYAASVGELYKFDTDKEAKDWAAGGYKKQYNKGGKVKSKVNQAGNYTQPGMRKRIFNRIKAGSKGGNPGQWSARKAQMLAKSYKSAGGGYKN